MRQVALVSARAARSLDEDLPPLRSALAERGAAVQVVDWDNPAVDWSDFELAVLRSTWDYTERLPEFLDWIQRAAASTCLLNPPAVVAWNTDKHYLAELTRAGVTCVPSRFVEPDESAQAAIDAFLTGAGAAAGEFVIKPAVGAGSRDAQRHARGERDAAVAQLARLLAAWRSALLQPYLAQVDTAGETALVYVAGRFSHAARKGPLLRRGEEPTAALFAPEQISPREPAADELRLGQAALAALPFPEPLLYARVDLIRAADGSPRLLELELTEPSLFFACGEGSAERFANAMLAWASGQLVRK